MRRKSRLSLRHTLYLLKNLTLYFDKNKLLIKRTTTFWTCTYRTSEIMSWKKKERKRDEETTKGDKKEIGEKRACNGEGNSALCLDRIDAFARGLAIKAVKKD